MTDGQKRYREYLESDHWSRLKVQAGGVWGHQCYVCEKTPIDWHHLNYRNLHDCTPDDLVPLCRGCHKAAHFEGRLFFTIKHTPLNDDKRALLREGLLKVRKLVLTACTEAPRDRANYEKRRAAGNAFVERNKAAQRLAHMPAGKAAFKQNQKRFKQQKQAKKLLKKARRLEARAAYLRSIAM